MIKKIANIDSTETGSQLVKQVQSILEQQGLLKTAKFTMYMDAETAIIKLAND